MDLQDLTISHVITETPTLFSENRELPKAASYNKRWESVRQNKKKKGDLVKAAEISNYLICRLTWVFKTGTRLQICVAAKTHQ